MASLSALYPLYSTAAGLPELPAPSATVHTLENGLTIIVEEDHGAPVASVQAWVNTGSIHEGKWLGAGLSHILEHMLFKGTEKRRAGDIARAIQDQGGYINAYTSFDRTVYWIDVPSSGVAEAVDILSDAMLHSTLPEEEYVKEQEVIRREFAMGKDDPGREAIQSLLRTMYPDSPRGLPIIGHLDIYNRLTRDDVMEYYKARYVPNNMTFIVVGDVDTGQVVGQLREIFEGEPRGVLAPVYVPREEPQLGKREVHGEFPTELSRLYLAWRVPGLDDPEAPALELLGSILGNGRSSLLNQELREKRRLAHAVSAGVYNMPGESAFFVSAIADPDKRAELETEILAEIEKIQREGVPSDTLEKARRSMLSSLLGELATAKGKASGIGNDWMLTRNLDFGRQFLEALSKVTDEEVQAAAAKYLTPGRLTVASLNPPGSPTAAAAQEAAAPAGEIQKFTLPNGLRLLVREDSRLPLVSMTMAFRGGLLAETPATNGITQLLAQTMLKGTSSRSAAQISEEIESLGGGIGSDSGNNTLSVSVGVMRPDLAKGMEILADVVLNPSFPAGEVDLEKDSQIAGIKADEDQITSVARNLLRERLFGSHPYALRASGTERSVSSLTRDDLVSYHSRLAGAKNAVLAVFGDVDAQEVLRLAGDYFGAMPAGKIEMENPPVAKPLAEMVRAVEERDKKQAVLMVGYLGTTVDSADRPALELLAAASSDIGSRFFDRIREQMGLAYFVGAQQMIGLAPGVFVFYLGTDPHKVGEVTSALNEEISRLAAEGLSAEELDRAKKKLIGGEAIRNQSNRAFAQTVAVDELVGLGHDHYSRREEEIRAVSLEDVRRVARKYFLESKPVEITVHPRTPGDKAKAIPAPAAEGA